MRLKLELMNNNRSNLTKSLGQRIRDHLFFSVVVMSAIFVVLSLAGIKARFASLVLSILLTLALNVGLSYYYEYRANRALSDEKSNSAGASIAPDSDIRFKN